METKTLTPIKAIRKHCLNCQGNRPSLVRSCESVECYLYPYRMGRSVGRKGIGGFKTHRRNVSVDRSENSSIGQGNHIPLSNTQPISTTQTPITPQFLNEIEGLLDKVAILVQDDTAQLIEKVKSLKLMII